MAKKRKLLKEILDTLILTREQRDDLEYYISEGEGGNYEAGDGINIINNIISVNSTIARLSQVYTRQQITNLLNELFGDYYTKSEIDEMIGEIDTALGLIIG